MDVKEAVAKAKSYVADLFQSEQIHDLILEETELDDRDEWLITVSFCRHWEPSFALRAGLGKPRSYKVVRLSPEGGVISVKDRILVAA